jgi:hypothetical protein
MGVSMQLAMFKELAGCWIRDGKGRGAIDFHKSFTEESEAVGFLGRHCECVAETHKAQMFFRGTCQFSCWNVISDLFVVHAATCKESKGGIKWTSGPEGNG